MFTTHPPKISSGHAHSKLILVGEHAVVYGKPAIAIPFPLEVTSMVESRAGIIMIACTHYVGPIDRIPMQLKGIALCIKQTLKYLKKPYSGLHIKLNSTIPVGRGLGSSAAIAISIVRGLFSFYEKNVSQEELMSLVQVAEMYAHGNPSGIDMVAASSELPIWFQKDKETVALEVGAPLFMVVADTGRYGDTFTAVKNVKENYRLAPQKIKKSIERIERIAQVANSAIKDGDTFLLGRLLDANQDELMTIGVSDDRLNRLVGVARNAGALGAKLTGGGRGGCMIALARNRGDAERIANHLMTAGAYKTWYFNVEASQ